MAQLNDLWVTYLQGLGYTGKNYNDLLQRALRFYGSSQRKNLNDLWKEYLTERGYTGSVPDMQYKWLGDKGYTGNLNDRFVAALEAENLFTTP